MKTLEKSEDKIQRICDELRKNTLEPAQIEAKKIIEQAHEEARKIREEGEKERQKMLKDGQEEIEKQKTILHSSLVQASRQAIESLKQSIINHLFSPELNRMIEKGLQKADVVGQLVSSIVKALDKEGLSGDLNAYIAKDLNPAAVNQTLLEGVVERLKNNSVEVGDFPGGAVIKYEDKQMKIDISDKAIKELMGAYLKKPQFRELIFGREHT